MRVPPWWPVALVLVALVALVAVVVLGAWLAAT